MKRFLLVLLYSFAILLAHKGYSQSAANDSVRFNYDQIYSLCLNGDVKPVLSLIDVANNKKIALPDMQFKKQFESRFKLSADSSDYLTKKQSSIDSLLTIFHDYWRASLLDTSKNFDQPFIDKLNIFFSSRYTNNRKLSDDSIDFYFKKYIEGKGLNATDGIGKTGRLYDLLVWRNEKDTTYTFTLQHEKITARVMMMDNFITLGWEEYSTLGKYYPGGWATKQMLFCVKKAYNLNSERFLISYLAHEGRHFSDYQLFPKLRSEDLEYRAKLTELSLAKKSLYQLVKFFINNADKGSKDGHSAADYRVISDISKILFKVDFEKNIDNWKMINTDRINKVAYQVLQKNTLQNLHSMQ